MIIQIDRHTSVNELVDGSLAVTRLSILGQVATHVIPPVYDIYLVAAYLQAKVNGWRTKMIQDVFPDLNLEDREFLLSGITPAKWNAMFNNEGGE